MEGKRAKENDRVIPKMSVLTQLIAVCPVTLFAFFLVSCAVYFVRVLLVINWRDSLANRHNKTTLRALETPRAAKQNKRKARLQRCRGNREQA